MLSTGLRPQTQTETDTSPLIIWINGGKQKSEGHTDTQTLTETDISWVEIWGTHYLIMSALSAKLRVEKNAFRK